MQVNNVHSRVYPKPPGRLLAGWVSPLSMVCWPGVPTRSRPAAATS